MAIIDDVLNSYPLPFFPIGTLTTGTAATATAIPPPAGANRLMIQCNNVTDTAAIRFTLDGVDPSTTTGFRLLPSQAPLILTVNGLVTLKVIRESANASVSYQWGFDQTLGGAA